MHVELDKGVALRPLQRSDCAALVEAAQANAEHLQRWLPWTDVLRDAEQCAAKWERWLPQEPEERAHFYVLVEGETILGMVFLFRINGSRRRGEIGYWLAKAGEGRGLMTAACRALIEHIYATTDLDRLYIRAASGNDRSIAVARRLGFTYEGLMRHDAYLRGQPIDVAMYSMLRDQWGQIPEIGPYERAPRLLQLSDGRTAVIREAEPDDAAAVVRHRQRVAGHRFLTSLAEELTDTVESQERFLQQTYDDPDAVMFVAMVEAEVIGLLGFNAEKRKKIAHRGSFGIAIQEAWRGQGIGRAMIEQLLSWAKAHPTVEKVCLGAYSENAIGLRLYRRMGFIEEGCFPRHVRQLDGTYDTEIAMYRMVKG